jgi:ribosomal protein S21
MEPNGTQIVFLTKDQILAAADLPEEVVDVPEWGGKVLIRGMTGAERDAFEESVMVTRGNNRELNLRNFRAKLVARSIVDPVTKERMFSDNEIAELGKKSARALQRVFEAALRLNGMTAESVEELTKSTEETS